MRDLWAGVVPASARLAFILTGDLDHAAAIARRTYVRLLARFQDLRDPYAIEILTRRSIVRQARRIKPRPPADATSREGRLWSAFLGLRARRRAALALQLLEGMDDGQIGDVLGCSASGARSHIDHALVELAPLAVVPAEVSEEVAAVLRLRAEMPQVGVDDYPATARRARLLRGLTGATAFAMAAALGVGLAFGGRAVLAGLDDARGGSVDLARDDADAGPAPRNPIDASPSVTPGWCPPARRMLALHPSDRMAASSAAVAFGVSLGQGYQSAIEKASLRSPRIPSPAGWPRPQSGRLRVIQSGAASGDELLGEDCGRKVATRTWKVVMREFEERETNNVFVVYLVRTEGGWRAWATLVGVSTA